jgi:NAD-dependent deacetylase
MTLNIVVLSGAGISAESGIKTFRDSDGLWENYRIQDVATPMAFEKNPELVLDFYNMRRRQVLMAQPNQAHLSLAIAQGIKTIKGNTIQVHIVTQNIDDLHERAGSEQVLHLHGEILKVRSIKFPHLIYSWQKDLTINDRCEKGSPMRPHIVWFHEEVPMMEKAILKVQEADVLMIVGTSLLVYPAAGLVHYRRAGIPVYVIDPHLPEISGVHPLHTFSEPASSGVAKALQHIKMNY